MSRLIIVIEVSSTKYKRRQNGERDKGFNYFREREREREREIIIIKLVSHRQTLGRTDSRTFFRTERSEVCFSSQHTDWFVMEGIFFFLSLFWLPLWLSFTSWRLKNPIDLHFLCLNFKGFFISVSGFSLILFYSALCLNSRPNWRHALFDLYEVRLFKILHYIQRNLCLKLWYIY